jgi:hypothetical protein
MTVERANEDEDVSMPAIGTVWLYPHEIEAWPECNSRRYRLGRDSLIGLAMSLIEEGQQEPIKVQRIAGRLAGRTARYRLVFGYWRWAAAKLINDEKLTEKPFGLCAVVTQGTAKADQGPGSPLR